MKQEETYKNIWKEFSNPAKSVIESQSPEWKKHSITVNLLIKGESRDKLCEFSREIKKRFSHNKFVPKEHYHVTVCPIQWMEKLDRKAINEYANKVKDIAKDYDSFELDIRGINHFHNVLFAQIFSKDKRLFELNERIADALKVKQQFSFTPHASLLSFRSNPKELFKFIEPYRQQDFGSLTVKEIQLVDWASKGHTPVIFKRYKLKSR